MFALLQSPPIESRRRDDAAAGASPSSSGERITFRVDARDNVLLWAALKVKYEQLRGADPDPWYRGRTVPRTTNADVRQLMLHWTKAAMHALASVTDFKRRDISEIERWQAHRDRVVQLIDSASPNAVYEDNADFWKRATRRLAQYLNSTKVRPDSWELWSESWDEAKAEAPLPIRLAAEGAEAVGDAAVAVGGATAQGAKAVGGAAADAASAVGGGIKDFFQEPLTIALTVGAVGLAVPLIVSAVRK